MLADTHAHIYWPDYKDDLDQVLTRAKENHVGIIINVGVSTDLSQRALDQIGELENYPDISFYSSIGIHPHEAVKFINESLAREIDQLEQIYQSNPAKVRAVGEIGLDYLFKSNPDYIPDSLSIEDNKALQKKLFRQQIALATKLNLPLLIHVRDDRSQDPNNTECWDEAVEMAKKHFGIFHCYSGLPSITQKILSTRYLFSFAANITYPKNDYLREAAKLIPLDRIVLETDSPFLSPQSSRGRRNEPSSVLEIAKLISNLKGISLRKVEEKTTENARVILKLK